jgi:acetylornithine deacetylase/succinyl-diaminopimelate desuccinylase-like protein
MDNPRMTDVAKYLADHDADFIRNLTELVAVPSISTDGQHRAEIEKSGAVTAEQMTRAGLSGVELIRFEDSYPYAYGEWLGAPGKPTVFLYAHHDVQPVNYVEQWKSDPWTLTERDGRLYGRGAADDKAAITLWLSVIEAYLKTVGKLPLNVKVLVEGEEEVGSKNLVGFFERYRDKIKSDVICVADTENVRSGIPSITYSLRGVLAVKVTVEGLAAPVHSGMAGGLLPDAAIALNAVLARLYWADGKVPIPGFYDQVRELTPAERAAFAALPGTADDLRRETGMVAGARFALEKGYSAYETTSRRPAVTVIAQEAGTIAAPSNQVLPRASAIVSVRTVPDQDSGKVLAAITKFLSADPPWGLKVTVEPHGAPVSWWMTDPRGPAFEAAMSALKAGFNHEPAAIGCGGSIGFVGPLAELFGGAPALLMGIEDPLSAAHSPNESLHAGDFRKLLRSTAGLFENLGKLSRVK